MITLFWIRNFAVCLANRAAFRLPGDAPLMHGALHTYQLYEKQKRVSLDIEVNLHRKDSNRLIVSEALPFSLAQEPPSGAKRCLDRRLPGIAD